MNIELWDAFNDRIISTHRTIRAAVLRSRKHDRSVKRANGNNSYIPYAYRYSDGTPVEDGEIMEARMQLDNEI